jgi:tellurite resistance protein
MAGPLFYERVMSEGSLDRSAAEAILEIAYLTMSADQRIAAEERAAFAAIAARLLHGPTGEPLSPGEVDRWIGSLARESAHASPEERVELLAKTLDGDARKAAYQVACVMALADQDESDREFEFDLTLISALDLEQEEADALAAEVRLDAR